MLEIWTSTYDRTRRTTGNLERPKPTRTTNGVAPHGLNDERPGTRTVRWTMMSRYSFRLAYERYNVNAAINDTRSRKYE